MANDSQIVEDVLADFESGVNQDPPPLKLARTQLSNAVNLTVRGQYARPRPPYNKIQLSVAFDVAATGLLQAALYYKPDSEVEFLLIAVSGNLWKIALDGTATKVSDATTTQNAIAPQHWMWQAEKWVVWNDGLNLPVFFNGRSCFRSNGQQPLNNPTAGGYSSTIIGTSGLSTTFQNTVGGGVTPPIFTLTLATPYTGSVGDYTKFAAIQSVKPPAGSGITLKDGAGNTISQYDFNLKDLGFYFSVEAISGNTIDVKLATGTWPPVQYTGWRYLVSVPTATAIQQYIPPYSGTLSQDLILPNPTDVGDSATLKLIGNYNGQVGDFVQVGGAVFNYIFEVDSITSPTELVVKSYNVVISSGGSVTVPAGSSVRSVLVNLTPELPAGKMGAYGRGRIVMALTDGKRFVIGDLVGGSAGTPGDGARDAVLHITENNWLNGGGFFTVPGGVGDIRSITFTATLDSSLGQGACQIGTPTHMFGLNLPTDRTTWATLTDPLLPVSLIGFGPMSQNGTITVNSDIIFRSVIGMGSLIMARRDFSQYGNVPMSQEVDKTLSEDDTAMLQFVSAIDFDNRVLMTAGPHASEQGIYFDKIIALNNDPVSSLRGKAPSVYDGYWTGLNVMALVTGLFASKDRAFAFTRSDEGLIELHEIRKSNTTEIYDDGVNRIEWIGETCSLFKEYAQKNHTLLRLEDGEMSVDLLDGRTQIEIWLKPDQYPCWTLWHRWSQCAQTAKGPLPLPANPETLQVQFRPRIGFGTPSGTPCDSSTGRPMREGYTFQIKFVIRGQCRFLGARFRAVTVPQPKFAPPICCDE